jgi:succinate dehydrogenase / fumarate reductase iron-sulfur subunit
MRFTLDIWTQESRDSDGRFERHEIDEIDREASFLEMLDQLNERLIQQGSRTIAFDSDCREGICGSCSLLIDGLPHGPNQVTTCQTYMRDFADGATIRVEPFRVNPFPVLRDLVTDRSPLDRIIQSGGYISVRTGPQPDPNSMPVSPAVQERAMDAAACIGCGACVAACPNGSAMLFTGAKLTALNLLPQGQPERNERSRSMVLAMDDEGFGGCTNYGECQLVCPAGISIDVIGTAYREFRRAARTRKSPSDWEMRAQ